MKIVPIIAMAWVGIVSAHAAQPLSPPAPPAISPVAMPPPQSTAAAPADMLPALGALPRPAVAASAAAPAASPLTTGSVMLNQAMSIQAQLALVKAQQSLQDARQNLTLSQIKYQQQLSAISNGKADSREGVGSRATNGGILTAPRSAPSMSQAYTASVTILGTPSANVVWGDGTVYAVQRGTRLPGGAQVVAIDASGVQVRQGHASHWLPFRGIRASATPDSVPSTPTSASALTPTLPTGWMTPPTIPNPPVATPHHGG